MRSQACYCGKTTKMVGCSSGIDGFECEHVCDKLLSCGKHRCTELCHEGPCPICPEVITETCFCGSDHRKTVCGTVAPTNVKENDSESSKDKNERKGGYSCGKKCAKMRDCGNHECGNVCHPGPCEICLRLPTRQRYCPCGKS
uniref:Transcriptional repressor NF-X1 n=1 Tax=Lygus hesperus TaxID=30085 RepID=A0A0A9XL54_LYGHE